MRFIKFLFRLIAKITGRPGYWLMMRERYYLEDGKKRTRRYKGPAILIANHTHIIDYFTMLFAHPAKHQRFLVSEAIYQHPFLGWLSKMMDNILVHRERNDLTFMAEAEKSLAKGHTITIFPEGHINHTPQKLDPFKPAAVYLALRTGVPIIPHYIEAHYFKIKRTRVIMGKPIYVSEYCNDPNNPTVEEVRNICELLRNKTNELKRKMAQYRKYKTRNIIYWKAWFLDIVKAVLWLPNKFVFPTKYHYVNGARYKDRYIRGRGLVVSKHYGFNDPPILCMAYFSRRLRIIVGSDLYDNYPFFLKHFMTIRYDRVSSNSDPKCFLEVINLLKAEGVVGIYPEGHISKIQTDEFHEGAAYFAIMGDAPVYLYYMMKPWKPFRINHVMIDKPLNIHDFFTPEQLKEKETIAKFNEILKTRYFALRNEGQKYIKKSQKSAKK